MRVYIQVRMLFYSSDSQRHGYIFPLLMRPRMMRSHSNRTSVSFFPSFVREGQESHSRTSHWSFNELARAQVGLLDRRVNPDFVTLPVSRFGRNDYGRANEKRLTCSSRFIRPTSIHAPCRILEACVLYHTSFWPVKEFVNSFFLLPID